MTVDGTYIPIGGDFDGNGYADILWYRPGSAPDFQWNFRPDGNYQDIARTINGTYRPFAGDFDANTVDDIVWYTPGAGADWLWSYNLGGATYTNQRVSQSGGLHRHRRELRQRPCRRDLLGRHRNSELWTEYPTEYWWSDTFLDNMTAAPEGPAPTTPESSSSTGSSAYYGSCDTREAVLFRESRTAAKVDRDDCSVDKGTGLLLRQPLDDLDSASTSTISCHSPKPGTPAQADGQQTPRRLANDLGIDYALVRSPLRRTPQSPTPIPQTGNHPRRAPGAGTPANGLRSRIAGTSPRTRPSSTPSTDAAHLSAEQPLLPADPRSHPSTTTPPPAPAATPSGTCSTKGNA